jgi:hypothetical protein
MKSWKIEIFNTEKREKATYLFQFYKSFCASNLYSMRKVERARVAQWAR